jgi:hypothetical protein
MVTRCSRSPLTDAPLNRGGDGHQYPQEFQDASSFELGLDLFSDERVSRRTYVSWRCIVSSHPSVKSLVASSSIQAQSPRPCYSAPPLSPTAASGPIRQG